MSYNSLRRVDTHVPVLGVVMNANSFPRGLASHSGSAQCPNVELGAEVFHLLSLHIGFQAVRKQITFVLLHHSLGFHFC